MPAGTDVSTGLLYSPAIPSWQRTYYEQLLLETLRIKSIMVPFCAMKQDFRARDTGVINYTEVYDTDPNYNPLAESDIWLTGTHLDSRSVQISLAIYGDTLKFSDYAEVVSFVNNGDMNGLVRNKIGQNQVDMLDILARNAYLSHPNPVYAGGTKTTREGIATTDIFNPDFGELARTHLEEAEIPGVQQVEDAAGPVIVCVTTPRVIHDIRTAAASKWLEVQQYVGTDRKFTNEVGTWGGVRYIRTDRMRLRNHGAVVEQTTLSSATVVGQGAASTVDTVYAVGQSNSTRYVPVAAVTGFAVGQYVTIHDQNTGAGAGHPPVETDGTQETRRIVSIDTGNKRLVFEKPLLKPHASGDFVTNAVDIHASAFLGGPSVVYGVGEAPTPTFPPKIDDLQMVNRVGWRGFLKFQMFRPEFLEVHFTSGTTN